MPDQAGWHATIAYWADKSCSQATLAEVARNLLTSSEFLATSPSPQEKIFRLYRATLHRDATAAELTNGVNLLNGGANWTNLVNNVFTSFEFNQRVTTYYCSGKPTGWQNTSPANLLVTSTGAVTTEAGLRSALSNATAGSTVAMEQGAVIFLSAPITVPPGVTLTTVGQPGASRTPLLARLARSTAFADPMVYMEDNSRLNSVWVDGRRNQFGLIGGPNVRVEGDNVSVTQNILTDSTAFTHLQYYKQLGTGQCYGGYAADNLITAYGSEHQGSQWSDGIGISCTGVIVERNNIVDPSDVGIVVFRPAPSGNQNSIVRNNAIFNVGNSAFSALAADPLGQDPGFVELVPAGTVLDFTGTTFSDNVIWTSPSVHLDIVLADGTRPWSPDRYIGKGARFLNNNSGTETVTSFVTIAVSGMQETTVQSNAFSTIPAPSSIPHNCGNRSVIVAPLPYGNDAASNIQAHTVVSANDSIVTGCITGH